MALLSSLSSSSTTSTIPDHLLVYACSLVLFVSLFLLSSIICTCCGTAHRPGENCPPSNECAMCVELGRTCDDCVREERENRRQRFRRWVTKQREKRRNQKYQKKKPPPMTRHHDDANKPGGGEDHHRRPRTSDHHHDSPDYKRRRRSPPDHHASPEHGSPHHGSPSHESPEHGSPRHGSPQHGSPKHGSPTHDSPDHHRSPPEHGSPDHHHRSPEHHGSPPDHHHRQHDDGRYRHTTGIDRRHAPSMSGSRDSHARYTKGRTSATTGKVIVEPTRPPGARYLKLQSTMKAKPNNPAYRTMYGLSESIFDKPQGKEAQGKEPKLIPDILKEPVVSKACKADQKGTTKTGISTGIGPMKGKAKASAESVMNMPGYVSIDGLKVTKATAKK